MTNYYVSIKGAEYSRENPFQFESVGLDPGTPDKKLISLGVAVAGKKKMTFLSY